MKFPLIRTICLLSSILFYTVTLLFSANVSLASIDSNDWLQLCEDETGEFAATFRAIKQKMSMFESLPINCKAAFEKAKCIKTLDLSGSNIMDLTPLSIFSELVELDISNNDIASVMPLKYLKKLRYLDARFNKISDFSMFKSVDVVLGKNHQITQENINWFKEISPGFEHDVELPDHEKLDNLNMEEDLLVENFIANNTKNKLSKERNHLLKMAIIFKIAYLVSNIDPGASTHLRSETIKYYIDLLDSYDLEINKQFTKASIVKSLSTSVLSLAAGGTVMFLSGFLAAPIISAGVTSGIVAHGTVHAITLSELREIKVQTVNLLNLLSDEDCSLSSNENFFQIRTCQRKLQSELSCFNSKFNSKLNLTEKWMLARAKAFKIDLGSDLSY